MKRVVISGLGVVSCLGNNQDEVYKSFFKALKFNFLTSFL